MGWHGSSLYSASSSGSSVQHPFAFDISQLVLGELIQHSQANVSSSVVAASTSEECSHPPLRSSSLPPSIDPLLLQFTESDQVYAQFREREVCDLEGNPLPPFDSLKFPWLNCHHGEGIQQIIWALIHLLRTVSTLEGPGDEHLEIAFSLEQLFTYQQWQVSHQYHLRQQDQYIRNEGGEVVEVFLPKPIQDFQCFGTGVLNYLGPHPFIFIVSLFFGSKFENSEILAWFSNRGVIERFQQRGNDLDIRTLNDGGLKDQLFLSNRVLRFLFQQTKRFNPAFWVERLKKKDQKYHSFEVGKTSPQKILKSAILEFGLTKRKKVSQDGTEYAIVAFNMKEKFPIDLIFAGTADGKSALRAPCLSSTNCLTFSFLSLMQPSPTLKIESAHFSPAKSLVDLICGIATFVHPNVDAWRRFLRDCIRSMQPNIERDMVSHVLDQKSLQQFLSQKEEDSTSSTSNSQPEGCHLSEYLCWLVKDEIEKSQERSFYITQRRNCYTAVALVFRACESLRNHSTIADSVLKNIWAVVDKDGWLDFDRDDPAQRFFYALKHAMIADNVSFTELSAWIGILAWLLAPKRATTHCQLGVFHLFSPIRCIIPIDPTHQLHVIEQLLKRGPLPDSFKMLYESMAREYTVDQYISSPLCPKLDKLGIDSQQLLTVAERWIDSFDDFQKIIGLHLYVSIVPSISDIPFKRIFLSFLRTIRTPIPLEHRDALVGLLTTILSSNSPEGDLEFYRKILFTIKRKGSVPLLNDALIKLLLGSDDPALILYAYNVWMEEEASFVGWSLFHKVRQYRPDLALIVLERLFERFPNNPQLKFPAAFKLIESYRTIIPQQLVFDLSRIASLANVLIEQRSRPQFRRESEEQLFFQTLGFFISLLHAESSQVGAGDRFLVEASRQKLLDRTEQSHLWCSRLETLSSGSEDERTIALSLYELASGEGFIDSTASTRLLLQELKIKFGKIALRTDRELLSWHFWEEVYEEGVDQSLQKRFVLGLAKFFKHEIAHKELSQCHHQILNLLLIGSSIPLQGRKNIEIAYRQFFQRVNQLLRNPEEGYSRLFPISISLLDNLFLNRTFFDFMGLVPMQWKTILFEYLVSSLPVRNSQEIPRIGPLYDTALTLWHKRKNQSTPPSKDLYLFAPQVLKHLSNPSQETKDFIQENQHQILEVLIDSQLIEEGRGFVRDLSMHAFDSQELSRSIWRLCLIEVGLENPSIETIIGFVNLVGIDRFIETAPSDDLAILKFIRLFIHHAHINFAWEWMKKLPKGSQELIALTGEALEWASKFVNCGDFNRALSILIMFPQLPTQCSQDKQRLWLQLAERMVDTASLEELNSLFLNELTETFDTDHLKQLSRLASIGLGNALKTPLTSAERSFVVQLLNRHPISNAEVWEMLWIHILNSQSDERALFESARSQFDVNCSPPLLLESNHSVQVASCWTTLLLCLDKYFPSEVEKFFSDYASIDQWYVDPSTSQLKWMALKTILLRFTDGLSKQPPSEKEAHSAITLATSVLTEMDNEQAKVEQTRYYTMICNLIRYATIETWDPLQITIREAFSKINFAPEMKCRIAYALLKVFYKLIIGSRNGMGSYLQQYVDLYVQWAPFLFYDPKYLKRSIVRITSLTPFFTSGNSTAETLQTSNEDNLSSLDHSQCRSFVRSLLAVQFRVESSIKKHQQSMRHYHEWVMENIYGILPEFHKGKIDIVYCEIISEFIDQFDQRSLHSPLLRMLEHYIYSFPPQSPQKAEFHGVVHDVKRLTQVQSEVILSNAIDKGLLKEGTSELFALNFWVNCGNGVFFTDLEAIKRNRSTAQALYDRLLDQKTLFTALCALEVLSGLQASAPSTGSFKELLPNYRRMMEAIRPHITTMVTTKGGKKTIFGQVNDRTILQYKRDVVLSSYKNLRALTTLFFGACMDFVCGIDYRSTHPDIIFDYLELSLTYFNTLHILTGFQQPLQEYYKAVENYIPILHNLFFSKTSSIENSLIKTSAQQAIVTKWVKVLLNSDAPPHTLKREWSSKKQNKAAREVLFLWIRSLLSKPRDDQGELSLIIACLTTTLDAIIPANSSLRSPLFNEKQPDACELMQAILEVYAANPVPQSILAQKMIQARFYHKKMKRDLSFYLGHMKSIMEIIKELKLSIQPDAINQRLIELFFVFRPSNPSECSQKNEAFLMLFHFIQTLIENNGIQEHTIEVRNFVVSLLERCIDEEIIRNDNQMMLEAFEYFKRWIREHYGDITSVLLLELIVNEKKISQKTPLDLVTAISLIRKSLLWLVLERKDIKLSWRFVNFIIRCSLTETDRKLAFNLWLLDLEKHLDSTEGDLFKITIREHMEDLKQLGLKERLLEKQHHQQTSTSSSSGQGRFSRRTNAPMQTLTVVKKFIGFEPIIPSSRVYTST